MVQDLKLLRTFPCFCFSGCVSISAFALLIAISVGIASPAVGVKICAITTGIKKYRSIIIKKKKNIIMQCD